MAWVEGSEDHASAPDDVEPKADSADPGIEPGDEPMERVPADLSAAASGVRGPYVLVRGEPAEIADEQLDDAELGVRYGDPAAAVAEQPVLVEQRAAGGGDGPVVRYEPTPPDVVQVMLELADLTKPMHLKLAMPELGEAERRREAVERRRAGGCEAAHRPDPRVHRVSATPRGVKSKPVTEVTSAKGCLHLVLLPPSTSSPISGATSRCAR